MEQKYHDKTYLELLDHIMRNGEKKGDRTGTGTISVFGYQMRFDISGGSIPLLTTKKMHTKSIIHEILWYLQGSTNVKYLQDNGVRIWNEWSRENGDLGPVYGDRWRNWGQPKSICPPTPKLRDGIEPTYCGVANGSGGQNHPLKKTWEGMIERCYNPKHIGYHLYGEKGVYVVDRWLEFVAFAEDAMKLPSSRPLSEIDNLVLDKDGIGNGFVYGPETTQWITQQENTLLIWNKNVVLKNNNGEEFIVSNPTQFCIEQNLPNGADKNISDLWTGRKNAKERYGFQLVSVSPKNKHVDQIANVIKMLKTNPNDRRMIVSAWDVQWVDHMALPPCHLLFQFYSVNNKLSCQLYQRSCDAFLGVPFNIVQYSILTHMIAQVTDHEASEFIWTGGDVHLYLNHLEQATEQLSRKPYPSPRLLLNSNVKDIDGFKFDDFEIVDYTSHSAIKAQVSV